MLAVVVLSVGLTNQIEDLSVDLGLTRGRRGGRL